MNTVGVVMPLESEGIMINLISQEYLNDMSPEERIQFIVNEVKLGKVLVLERGLTAVEEMELIKITMAEIDHESFVGVETPGFSLSSKKRSFFDKMLGRSPPPRMMVVGPAHLLQTIRKDGKVVQAMLLTKNTLRPMRQEEVEGKAEIKVKGDADEEQIPIESLGLGDGKEDEPKTHPSEYEPPPPPEDYSKISSDKDEKPDEENESSE